MTDEFGRPVMPIPRPDPGTPPEPPKPPDPPKPPKPPSKAITKDTPFRGVGTLTPSRVCEILTGYPMASECQSLGISALALAQSFKESQYGKTAQGKNPLGLMVPGSSPSRLMTFASWTAAFKEWQRRMDDPTYAGGVYMPIDMPLERFIRIYVAGPGPGYANGETAESVALYLQQTLDRLNRYFGLEVPPSPLPPSPAPPSGETYVVAGLGKKISLPFPLRVVLIPPSQTNQRPGIPMQADRYVQHETGNPNPGAGAHMHQQYMANGAEGQQLGYHFTVDDTVAYQMVPVNEVTWHGGDGRGPCNFKGVSCELCINHPIGSAQDRQAQQNAAILAAEVMNAMELERLDPHVACIGTDHHCPDRILNQTGSFNGYRARVNQLRKERA